MNTTYVLSYRLTLHHYYGTIAFSVDRAYRKLFCPIMDDMIVAILIFLIMGVIIMLAVGLKLNMGRTKQEVTTIPGLKPTDPQTGNLSEIAAAGSLHQFLLSLHATHGPIASLWLGPQYVVSIASANLFRQHSQIFDRPVELFSDFQSFFTSSSIQFANGEDGKARRRLYDSAYSHGNVNQEYLPIFQAIGENMADKLQQMSPDEHIPLMETMFSLAIKSIAEASFGQYFRDDDIVLRLKKSYDICSTEIERRIRGDLPTEERTRVFEENVEIMMDQIKHAIRDRRSCGEEGFILLDMMLRSGYPEQQVVADSLTYFVGGFHTTGLLLTWGLYYLALHEDIQERVYGEVIKVIGHESIPGEAIKELVYMKQVLDETMRCSVLAPYAARVSDTDMVLEGYKVPAGVPVFHALGVTLQDGNVWPNPQKFDPDRFNPEARRTIPAYGFEPFGFAGRRRCPAYRFAYTEATVFLSILLRKFKFSLVEGQNVFPVFGFVTKPSEEIWVTIEERQSSD